MSILLDLSPEAKRWLVTGLIGLVAGWLASLVMGRRSVGLLATLLVGVAGSFIGPFIFDMLDFEASGLFGRILSATSGAIALLIVLRLLHKAA